MANPTTNYGFVLPTATDLVTDLPADFDVALQGVDTRLKALQPGTTLGDVAYSSATANTNTRLGIGSTGQVLTVTGGVPVWATPASGTPTFVGCSVYASANQNIANNTATLLTFNTEDFDSDAFHSTSTNTGRITIPTGKGGKYNIQAFGQWQNSTTGRRYTYLYKNGSQYALQETPVVTYNASLAWYFEITVSAVATDYFEIYVLQDSGGALDTRLTGDGSGGSTIIGRYQATFTGA